MNGNELLKYPRSAPQKWIRTVGGFGIVFGLAAMLAVPAELSATPLSGSAISGQPQAAILELLGSEPQLIDCCHAHPYPPYDEYCCHAPGGYVAGAVVGGAIAYGVYRGVRSSVHHHHGGHYGGGRPGGGRPGGGHRGRRR